MNDKINCIKVKACVDDPYELLAVYLGNLMKVECVGSDLGTQKFDSSKVCEIIEAFSNF